MNASSDSIERFRAVNFETYPAGSTTELLFSEEGQFVREIGYKTAFILRLCAEPKSLAQHIGFLASRLEIEDRASVSRVVKALAEAGLLRRMSSLRAQLAATSTGTKSQDRITSVGILTSDRPQALERCLQTYTDHFSRKGRHPRMIVVDDSRESSNLARNQSICTSIAHRSGFSIVYVGDAEKRQFRNTLESEGMPPAVLEFGLPIGSLSHSTGANRNYFLLATTGEQVLSVDDDTECCTWLHPEAQSGIAISGHDDPTEIWPFESRGEAFEFAGATDIDLLATHEELLGQSFGYLLQQANIATICQHQIAAAVHGAPEHTVRVTISGMAGDSGMYSSRRLLFATGATRSRLAQDEAVYQLALNSREMARISRQACVSHSGICIAMVFGLDNREFLPPFMPHWRNQDGVFSSTLAVCEPQALFANARCGIWHNATRSSQYRANVFECATRTRISELVMLLLSSCPASLSSALGMTRTELLARHLMGLNRIDMREFAITLKRALIDKRCRQLAEHEALVTKQFDYPDYWLADFKRYRATTMRALVGETFPAIDELDPQMRSVDMLMYVQQYVSRFGELLLWWPQLMNISKRLRARGILLGSGV